MYLFIILLYNYLNSKHQRSFHVYKARVLLGNVILKRVKYVKEHYVIVL